MAQALPASRQRADDVDARGDALYGAWLCGSVLANVGMALHHKLCHTLGGSFNLPPAEVHTVVLPKPSALNASPPPAALPRIARPLGTQGRARAPAALFSLVRHHRPPVPPTHIVMSVPHLYPQPALPVPT